MGGRGQVGTVPRPPISTILAITVTGITVNSLLSSSIPDILSGLDAPLGLAGLLIAAGTLPGIVLAPVIGLLADRYGRRVVLVPCLVLFGVAGGLGALAPSLAVLVGLRVLQGVGSAGLINLALVIIGDHWEGAERSRLIGRNAAALTVSLAIFPVIGGAVTDLIDWRALFLLYPAALVTAVWVLRTLPRVDRQDSRVGEQLRRTLPLLASRQVVGVVVAAVLVFALIFGLLLTILPVYLDEAFGLSAGLRGLVIGLPALTNTAAALSLGWLSQRVSRRAQLLAGTALLATATTIVGLAPSLPLLLVGVLLFGAGEGLLVPSLQDIATSATTGASRGTVVATFVGASRLGQTAGPLAAGAGLAAVGARATFVLGAGVALVLAVVVGGTGSGDRPSAHRTPGSASTRTSRTR